MKKSVERTLRFSDYQNSNKKIGISVVRALCAHEWLDLYMNETYEDLEDGLDEAELLKSLKYGIDVWIAEKRDKGSKT